MHSRKKIAKIAFGLLAGLGVLLAVRARAPAEAARAQPPAEPGPVAVMGGYLGTGTCAASGCHGGVVPKKSEYCLQDEYTQWMAHDKHTQAFSVLWGERAQKMARNLAPTNPDGKVIAPHTDTRCLACHTIPQLAVKDAPPEAVKLREQGVGCEACHGPAWGKKPWLVEHTAPVRWREAFAKNPDDPKWKDYDFNDLSDLPTQAKVCAGC